MSLFNRDLIMFAAHNPGLCRDLFQSVSGQGQHPFLLGLLSSFYSARCHGKFAFHFLFSSRNRSPNNTDSIRYLCCVQLNDEDEFDPEEQGTPLGSATLGPEIVAKVPFIFFIFVYHPHSDIYTPFPPPQKGDGFNSNSRSRS